MTTTPNLTVKNKFMYHSVVVMVDGKRALNVTAYNTKTKKIEYMLDRLYFEGESNLMNEAFKLHGSEKRKTTVVENSWIEFIN